MPSTHAGTASPAAASMMPAQMALSEVLVFESHATWASFQAPCHDQSRGHSDDAALLGTWS